MLPGSLGYAYGDKLDVLADADLEAERFYKKRRVRFRSPSDDDYEYQ